MIANQKKVSRQVELYS